MLLTTGIIIIYVVNPLMVVDKFLLNSLVDIFAFIIHVCFIVLTCLSSHCKGRIVAYYKS